MKSKIFTLMMAVALLTNVMAQAQTTVLYDINFSSDEWLDAFAAKGYDFRSVAANTAITFGDGTQAYVLTDLNGGFSVNANGFKEPSPFTSVCGSTFEYSVRLRNGAVTFIGFPEQIEAGKYKMTLYVNNPNATTESTFYLTDGIPATETLTDGKDTGTAIRWIPASYLASATISAANSYSPGQLDEEVILDNIQIEAPVNLNIWKYETRFLKVFRIIMEKYDDNTSIQSPVSEKTDLFVTGKTLSLSGNVNNGDLSVFNLAGGLVFNCKVNSNKVDLQNINAGAYVAKLITKEGETIRKVIVK